MHRFSPKWVRLFATAILALGGSLSAETIPAGTVVTNLQELQSFFAGHQRITSQLHLQAVVFWVSPARDQAVIQDESGAVRIELDTRGSPVQAGDIIALEGSATSVESEAGVMIGKTLVVSSIRHSADVEPSGKVFLTQGLHPIRVTWFDPAGTNIFNVSYLSPGGSKQTIPATALSHRKTKSSFAPGVIRRNYKGEPWQISDFEFLTKGIPPNKTDDIEWQQTPDFGELTPLKQEIVPVFNVNDQGRDHFSYYRFDGWFDAPQTGVYTFYPTPAGSSQVYIGLPQIRVLGQTNLPAPRQLVLGQLISPTQECQWAVVEGKVESISKGPHGYTLDLSSDTGQMRVRLNGPSNFSVQNWAGSQVRMTGIFNSVLTRGQHWLPGELWVPDPAHMELLSRANPAGQPEALGEMNTNLPEQTLLTSIESIKLLKPGEAAQGYPVRIEGVVTWAKPKAIILQDSGSAIYVTAVASDDNYHFRWGERWVVEGRTAELGFSPIIRAQHITRLGRGLFPAPLHPSLSQLINGSQDALYVEIRGRVAVVKANEITLLLGEGKLLITLPENSPEQIKKIEGALVRIRGCLFPVKNEVTHAFKIGKVEIRETSIIVDEPAPADPFFAPIKRVGELLQFDARAANLQSIKIIGQIVHQQGDKYCLLDDNCGLRFVLRKPAKLELSDQVEVVGYLDLSGPSPELREAIARKIGTASLPTPRVLPDDGILGEAWNFSWVQTEGVLVNLGTTDGEQLFGLQSGSRIFEARLPIKPSAELSFPIGCRLQVKGVLVVPEKGILAGLGINRARDGMGKSFEIQLNGPEDLLLVAPPPWSRLRQLLIVAAGLGGCVLILLVWNWSLRRQVARRGERLRAEISQREKLENLRALEEERSRIARDLHDDLGSSLTEISFLADAGTGSPASFERADTRFLSIGNKARALVNALDVIVWLINPKKDNLIFLAGYLGSYAEDYLTGSDIACRLNIPADFPNLKLNSQLRHNLFLAIKEVLHNIVKHAHASVVQIAFLCHDGTLEIHIADNGRGFDLAAPAEGNGLVNIKVRLANAGGECEFTSQPGAGTTVHIKLPLPTNPVPE